MNFGFTEEQTLVRDQVRRFMQEECNLSTVRSLMNSETRFDRGLWRQAANLGWLGMIVPEAYGGIGLKWIDLCIVLEETAAGLSPLPIASAALASAAVLRCGSEQHKRDWLPRIAAGEAICTIALYDEPNWIAPEAVTLQAKPVADGYQLSGKKPFVNDARNAQYFLLACHTEQGMALAALTRDQVTVEALPILDASKPMAVVSLHNVTIGKDMLLPLSIEDLSFLTDCGAVAVTAEMVGAAEAALNITNEYAKQRIQFGKPIGQYQGVKHRLADLYVDVESTKSLLYYAAWSVDDAPAELPRAISLAKGYSSDAFAKLGIDSVGLHGAIGFTAEYDIQLYLKRSKWARPMYGDSDYHLERVAALGGL